MNMVLFILFFTAASLQAGESEEQLARRVQAHLTIHDATAAAQEARLALLLYPQSSLLHARYISALAHSGDEKKMTEMWEAYVLKFPDKALNRELIEEMAWGILRKTSHSPTIIMREMALLAAVFSQDAKGISILC